jgi:hypothetical protein
MRQLLLEAIADVAAGRALRGTDSRTYRTVRPLDHIVGRERPWRETLRGEAIARF